MVAKKQNKIIAKRFITIDSKTRNIYINRGPVEIFAFIATKDLNLKIQVYFAKQK